MGGRGAAAPGPTLTTLTSSGRWSVAPTSARPPCARSSVWTMPTPRRGNFRRSPTLSSASPRIVCRSSLQRELSPDPRLLVLLEYVVAQSADQSSGQSFLAGLSHTPEVRGGGEDERGGNGSGER